MSVIERSALVSYSAQQMFALVNDIEAYPQFMAGCSAAKILRRGDDWLEAQLEINRGGVKQSFTTRNTLVEPVSMSMELLEGPFSKFSGLWEFQILSDSACKVVFTLDFTFSNPLMGMMMKGVFENVASEQVKSLCGRAKVIYSE